MADNVQPGLERSDPIRGDLVSQYDQRLSGKLSLGRFQLEVMLAASHEHRFEALEVRLEVVDSDDVEVVHIDDHDPKL